MSQFGRLQSGIGSHVAGFGTSLAFIEREESWKDMKVSKVKLPHDYALGNDEYASLCGEVVTYNIKDIEEGMVDDDMEKCRPSNRAT